MSAATGQQRVALVGVTTVGFIAWAVAVYCALRAEPFLTYASAAGAFAFALCGGFCHCAAGVIARRSDGPAAYLALTLGATGGAGVLTHLWLCVRVWVTPGPLHGLADGAVSDLRSTEVVGAAAGLSFGIGVGLTLLGAGIAAAADRVAGRLLAAVLSLVGVGVWALAWFGLKASDPIPPDELAAAGRVSVKEYTEWVGGVLKLVGVVFEGGLCFVGAAAALHRAQPVAPAPPPHANPPAPTSTAVGG